MHRFNFLKLGATGLEGIVIYVVDSLAQVVMTFHIQRIFHLGIAQHNLINLTPTRGFGVLETVV